jgi:hypothetical protein
MRWESPTEGRSGVPLRFPRPVIPVIAIGMAAVWVATGSAPAFADQVRSQEFWLSQLNVSPAWQVNRGTGITVAVLSDGIDAQHADLAGIVTTGPDFTGTGSGTGLVGTEVASLIAGRGTGTGSASGIAGIAPKAHILSVRVTLDPADTALDSTATGAALPGAIAQGIRYAVAHGAKVIDLPADPGRPNPNAIAALPVPRFATEAPQLNGILAAEGGSPAEQQAVAFALSQGVVLVAPAGDNALGTDAPNFPAAYPHVISVGAIDASFHRGAFSSNQPYVSVLAPGVGVTAADSTGGYTTVSSTTAASAMVSGIAALIKAQYPKLTPLQVEQAITTSTAVKPAGGQAPGSGTGSVDAGRAMLAAAALAAPLGDQAGAKAQPLASPPVPAAVPVSNSLAPRLVRAALISLAVLALLLGAILWYRRQTRRREQDSAQATADWARSTQNAFSAYGPGDNRTEADKMLEYFAAPSSNPTAVRRPFAAAAGTLTTTRGGGRSNAEAADAAAGTEAGGLGAWASVAPAPKTPSRQARVSGTPPWEPASQPASELPWAAVPGTVTGGRSVTPSSAGPGSDSIWPVTPAAATASTTSQSWEELAARTSAVRALPASDPAAPPTPDWDGPAADGPKTGDLAFGGAGAGFPAASRPVRADPASNGHAANGALDAPATAGSPDGSLWSSVSLPRSPSGSNWEALDSGPDDGSGAADEASWPKAQDDDAYRPAPEGENAWQPASHWEPADTAAHWQPQPDSQPQPDWQPQAEASNGPWQPADSGPQWQPPETTPQWLPAESAPQWQPAESAPQWQPGESAAAWSAAGGDSWPTPDSGRQWQDSGPASQSVPWEPAPAAAGWAPGAGSGWEPSVSGSSAHPGGDAAPEFDEPFGWRAARRPEGSPPASDEES